MSNAWPVPKCRSLPSAMEKILPFWAPPRIISGPTMAMRVPTPAAHGYGGARTKSAKAVKVERTATWIHADFYIMSHDHVVNVAPDVYLLPDPRTSAQTDEDGKETGFIIGRVNAHRKMLVKSNAYLKWGGYAEAGGFPPSDMMTPIITLHGTSKKRVSVTV